MIGGERVESSFRINWIPRMRLSIGGKLGPYEVMRLAWRGMARWSALLAVSVVLLSQTPRSYFAISVVDEATGRGVPLVELKTVAGVTYYTDSDGLVAFYEPGMMAAGSSSLSKPTATNTRRTASGIADGPSTSKRAAAR
jgi:hypothetical protein